MNVGVHRGLDPEQQAEEAARRGRQRRERLRPARRARARARARAAQSPAGPRRRRAARWPGRAAPASRAAADVPTRRPAPAPAAARGARLAEPTARPVLRKWLIIGSPAVGSGDPEVGWWASPGPPRARAAAPWVSPSCPARGGRAGGRMGRATACGSAGSRPEPVWRSRIRKWPRETAGERICAPLAAL